MWMYLALLVERVFQQPQMSAFLQALPNRPNYFNFVFIRWFALANKCSQRFMKVDHQHAYAWQKLDIIGKCNIASYGLLCIFSPPFPTCHPVLHSQCVGETCSSSFMTLLWWRSRKIKWEPEMLALLFISKQTQHSLSSNNSWESCDLSIKNKVI